MRSTFAFAALGLFLTAHETSAVPVYYTFEGEATTVINAGYSVGQHVSYTFMVDRESEGYNTDFNRTYTWVDEIQPTYGWDYFLVHYIGGDALPGLPFPSTDQNEFHLGVDYFQSGYGYTTLRGSNLDQPGPDEIQVTSNTRIDQWVLGQSDFKGCSIILQYGLQEIISDLTLTAISDVNTLTAPSVPEPSGLLLAGLGIGVLSLLTRKRIRG